jgi:glycosyltransferase involved in cell wall biosynthesis
MAKISIITSTYNRCADWLPKCIASVRAQTHQEYEHIIVDDCSTDNTKEYVASEMLNDKKIKYFCTAKNSGADPVPKNFGLSKAKSKYVLFLDDDVQLRPKALELLYKEMMNGYDVTYGDMWFVNTESPGIAHDFDLQFLSLRNYIDTSSALIRKSAIRYVGGFDKTLPKFVDWNLFVRLAKAGYKFKRVPEITFNYNFHQSSKSARVQTPMYEHPQLGRLYVPTFDPVSCPVRIQKHYKPKVAIFTIHYDRLEYSKQTYKEMVETAGYNFTWFSSVQNSVENQETTKWLQGKCPSIMQYPKNVGLTKASNDAIDTILSTNQFDIIIKIDNDVEFITYGWLKDIVELWEKNHLIYISPYVEGLVDNPGGAIRIGRALIGGELVEVTKHIGGIFAAISAKAYQNFRWKDRMQHGYQDLEASTHFVKEGYMPCYLPKHIIRHRDTTAGQKEKYPDYFERRKLEKTMYGA